MYSKSVLRRLEVQAPGKLVEEIDRLRTALAASQSRVEELEREIGDRATIEDNLNRQLAESQRENEELRADVVWAVRNGANAGYDGNSWPAIWHATSKPSMQTQHGEPVVSVEYDGTDADLCRAIREARCGARSESDE